MHEKMHRYVKELNNFYLKEPALYEVDFHYEGFEWIDCNDTEHSVVSFIRKGRDWRDMLIFVCNFTPAAHENYRIGAPFYTYYEEVFNSDREEYGGSNVVNAGRIHSEEIPFHYRPYSLILRIPPLATIVLRPEIKN